jgi:hypothetical protein
MPRHGPGWTGEPGGHDRVGGEKSEELVKIKETKDARLGWQELARTSKKLRSGQVPNEQDFGLARSSQGRTVNHRNQE